MSSAKWWSFCPGEDELIQDLWGCDWNILWEICHQLGCWSHDPLRHPLGSTDGCWQRTKRNLHKRKIKIFHWWKILIHAHYYTIAAPWSAWYVESVFLFTNTMDTVSVIATYISVPQYWVGAMRAFWCIKFEKQIFNITLNTQIAKAFGTTPIRQISDAKVSNRCLIPDHDDVIKWKHFPSYWSFVRWSTGDRWIPITKPVTRSFDMFFDLRLNKRLSKESRRQWFETSMHSLWCHSDGYWESVLYMRLRR